MGTAYRQLKRIIREYPEATIQTLVWASYFLMFPGTLGTFWDDKGPYTIAVIATTFPLVFLLNTYVFIPRYLKTRRWFFYVLAASIATIFWFGVVTLIFDLEKFRMVGMPISIAASAVIASFAYRFTRDWLINIGVIERLKAEKISMELTFLRSQVDPHFLFNTLNSLYAVALEEKSLRTADGIAQLGTLMRYNLHDSQTEFISLEKELDYIEQYIELQRLRLTEKTNLQVSISIDESTASETKIAPMVFIPFIENAFKYGVSPSVNTEIDISLSEVEGEFLLTVQNTLLAEKGHVESGGIGLKNVESRLNLIYPNWHSLSVQQTDLYYTVNLTLRLNT